MRGDPKKIEGYNLPKLDERAVDWLKDTGFVEPKDGAILKKSTDATQWTWTQDTVDLMCEINRLRVDALMDKVRPV